MTKIMTSAGASGAPRAASWEVVGGAASVCRAGSSPRRIRHRPTDPTRRFVPSHDPIALLAVWTRLLRRYRHLELDGIESNLRQRLKLKNIREPFPLPLPECLRSSRVAKADLMPGLIPPLRNKPGACIIPNDRHPPEKPVIGIVPGSKMELRRLELLTSSMPLKRSPS